MGLSDRFKNEKKKSTKPEKTSAYPSHVQTDLEMLEDIECMVLNKIAYTPVWSEFTRDEQIRLVRKYLSARLELPENAALVMTDTAKDAFVVKILASV